MKRPLIVLLVLLLAATALAQAAAIVTKDAPIYIRAEVTQTPLRVAARGTRLRVLNDAGDWLEVEFNDPQFGRRAGWVQRQFVTLGDETLKPMDLSVDVVGSKPPQPKPETEAARSPAQSATVNRGRILRDVKIVQVNPTVIGNANKVKEDFAANLVEDSLRNALRDANFELGEAPIRAHIVLDEFSSGNTAKRLLVGFGSGRSTVDGRLIFRDATGNELANVRLRVRGNLLWSGYQGGNTQRRQATNSFDQRLMEEIARLK